MFSAETNILWIVFSPIAVLTDIAAVFVVLHYRPHFHGTDVCLLSLLACMLLNALLLLPIPSVLGLIESEWNPTLCQFYVWLLFTLKIIQIISLVTVCVYCSVILKLPSDRKFFKSVQKLKLWLLLSWVGSAIIGMLPAIGAAGEDFFSDNKCAFLPYDIQVGFSIFFLIFNSTGIAVAVISFLDALFLLRSMKRIAVIKYRITRFHPPSASVAMNHSEDSVENRTRHDLYNGLNFSWDMCRFIVVLSTICFVFTHFPFTLIEFSQLLKNYNRETLESLVLWLILLDALLMPHILWACSKRYRHALVYQFKYYILRDKSVLEEDPSSCVLQSVTQRFIDSKGKQVTVTSRLKKDITATSPPQQRANGSLQSPPLKERTRPQSDSNIAVVHVSNGDIHRQEQYVGSPPYNDDTVASYSNDNRYSANSYDVTPSNPRRQSQPGSPNSLSPTRSVSSSKDGSELKRSSQRSSSRSEWKDKMRKKHLPAIFVNEAFDAEDAQKRKEIPSSINLKNKYVIRNEEDGQKSMYFYMSSDYHPDYLTDSLPRGSGGNNPSSDVDSEGVCNSYEDQDIDNILNDDSKDAKIMMDNSEIVIEQPTDVEQVAVSRNSDFSPEHIEENVSSVPGVPSDQYRAVSGGGGVIVEYDDHIQDECYEVPEVIHVYYDSNNSPSDTVILNTDTRYRVTVDDGEEGDITQSREKDISTDVALGSRVLDLDNEDNEEESDSIGNVHIVTNHQVISDNMDIVNGIEGNSVAVIPDIRYYSDCDTEKPEVMNTPFANYKALSESSEQLDKLTELDQVRPTLLEGAEDTSDNDTLKDSYTSVSYRALTESVGSDGSVPQTMYPPVHDIDQGFEEAIEMGYAMANGGGVNMSFDSFDDESSDSVFTNKEFEKLKPEEETFKTQAVVSSRPSSRSSFVSTPTDISKDAPFLVESRVTVGENDTSTVERGAIHIQIQEANKNRYPGKHFNPWASGGEQTSPKTPDNVGQSPWLDTSGSVADSEMSFESDFSEEMRTINQGNKGHKLERLPPNMDVYPAYF